MSKEWWAEGSVIYTLKMAYGMLEYWLKVPGVS